MPSTEDLSEITDIAPVVATTTITTRETATANCFCSDQLRQRRVIAGTGAYSRHLARCAAHAAKCLACAAFALKVHMPSEDGNQPPIETVIASSQGQS